MRRIAALGSLVSLLLAPALADAACCYFAAKDKDITQPGQKAFISWDAEKKIEAFTVQPKFEGNAVDFGMVIPTPSQPKLDEIPRDFFKDLAIYTILMPLPQPIWVGLHPVPPPAPAPGTAGGGKGFLSRMEARDSAVRVLEAGVVGSLDYKIIVAEKADGLYDWLKENHYAYSGDEATLKFYIDKKWFFTVMKIDPKQMKKAGDGSYTGEVTPTRFTFSSEECIYPLKITQISVKDQTDALFYVQSSSQMDLKGDLSWQHSYRVMYITYMLGCGAGQDLQTELSQRNDWVEKKKAGDPAFETTKLEWSKRLGEGEISVLSDPLKNYTQAGGGDLPPGAKAVSRDDLIAEAKAEYEKNNKEWTDYAKGQLENLKTQYDPAKGMIVKMPDDVVGKGYISSKYMWYPNREAPDEEVKGLTRLQGHLEKDRWLTKFRKILRKDEMSDDLVLVPVDAAREQTYVRIMPTSPP